MKAVLQRVSKAEVVVEGKQVGAIGAGLLILVGVERGDEERDSTFLAKKAVDMRIFNDDAGKMNLSVKDIGGSALIISQFTLPAEWKKGRRPSFIRAAEPAEGERLYEHFMAEVRALGIPVETGVFGAHMMVSLTNDGPVTIILDHQFANLEDTAVGSVTS
jgi:D-tyrosyl-tRNA(Tyr) deacylase